MPFSFRRAMGLAAIACVLLSVAASADAQRPRTAARRWPASARQLREAEVTAIGRPLGGATGGRAFGLRVRDGRGQPRDASGIVKSYAKGQGDAGGTHVHEIVSEASNRHAQRERP
jgi:hypothetical protein